MEHYNKEFTNLGFKVSSNTTKIVFLLYLRFSVFFWSIQNLLLQSQVYNQKKFLAIQEQLEKAKAAKNYPLMQELNTEYERLKPLCQIMLDLQIKTKDPDSSSIDEEESESETESEFTFVEVSFSIQFLFLFNLSIFHFS
jgi:hypothetical protein